MELTAKELEGLPKELLAQLSKQKVRTRYDIILSAIKAAGDKADLDNIIIGIHKATGEIKTRQYLTNNLYRMKQKKLIKVIGKGVYGII